MSLQTEVDDFIAKTQSMTTAAIAFVGEPPDDIARANIRRMRMATASLQAALDQANIWAAQGSMFASSAAQPAVGAKK